MRVAITVAYDGTNYLGSQVQKETKNTIFGKINSVLIKLGIETKIVASGRTDKAVHATGQVFHIDLPEFWNDLKNLHNTLNKMLPKSIQIRDIRYVDKSFHARYSAKKRMYRYIIKESNINPFQNNYVTFLKYINFKEIQENIKLFIGEHDFKYFMKTGSDINSTSRIIYKAFTYQHKGFIILNFEANGFLRSQIRMMVASLLNLDAKQIVEKRDNKYNHKVKPAPSNGLYLTKIKY